MRYLKYPLILISFLLVCPKSSKSQNQCDGNTPTFTIDMRGKADSIWLSTNIGRNGTCCSGGTNCVQFIITLDQNAEAIVLEIASGAQPSGSLSYTVNCGTPTAIGEKFCVTGAGPHSITFCKSGGNENVYRIKSIPRPMVSANFTTRVGCNSMINAAGFQESTIQWRAITSGTTYQSTIQCASACDSTIIITPSNPPSFIDYEVSGTPAGACSGIFARDTVRVSFVGTISASISPASSVLCKGTNTTTLTANVNGGNTPYTYLWSNGATTQSITVGAGTYSVNVSDETSCPNTSSSASITVDNDNNVNAGMDRSICSHEFPIVLSATSTQTAAWLGGNGIFTPNRNTINASYTPNNTELQNGSVQLILKSNACSHCPSVSDTVNFILKNSPSPTVTGSNSICGSLNQVENYAVDMVVGDGYKWTCNGGEIISSSNQSSISIKWNAYGTFQLNLKQTRPNACEVINSKTVHVSQTPSTPSIHRD